MHKILPKCTNIVYFIIISIKHVMTSFYSLSWIKILLFRNKKAKNSLLRWYYTAPLIILNFPISCLINSKCGKKLIYEGFGSELFQTFKLWPLKVFFEELKKLSPPKLNHILGERRQQKLWLGIIFNPTAQFFLILKNKGIRSKLKIWLLIWNQIKIKLISKF